MSRENVDIVRHPIVVPAQSRPGLADRIALRVPGLAVPLLGLVQRLPTRSRLRQAVTRRASEVAFAAVNRGDLDAPFALYHPEVELICDPAFVGLGFDPIYRGIEERIEFQRQSVADWSEFLFHPEELTYIGRNQLFYTGRVTGTGLSSGAAFDHYWANLMTLSGGRVVHEHFFLDREAALEAAGLSR